MRGETVGLITAAIFSGTFERAAEEKKEKERRYAEAMGLIYPEHKKDR